MTYDKIPYTQNIYKKTHPAHLATVAILNGLQSPPLARCRVLELGCATGINTLAMALFWPQSEFIGIDSSEYQIQQGQNFIRQMGIENLCLKAMDIRAVTAELGQFDYIIAHGVYSWVAAPVREKLFEICQKQLQPQGLAYISYNTYPGWSFDHMLRAMLHYHTRKSTEPEVQCQQAQQFLTYFTQAFCGHYDPQSVVIKKRLQVLNQLDAHYLFHEYLEAENQPVFFHEFIQHAERYGLRYVCDAEPSLSLAAQVPFEMTQAFQLDSIEKEQYHDFISYNSFRESILCHQHLTLKRSRHGVRQLYSAAPLRTVSEHADIENNELQQFQSFAGRPLLSIASPLLKAICLCLGEHWPQSLSFDSLMHQVQTKRFIPELSASDIEDAQLLLLDLYLKNIVELSPYSPQFTLTISEWPTVHPLARLQNQWTDTVANVRWEHFALKPIERYLLPFLDGHHDHPALLARLVEGIQSGALTDEPLTSTTQLRTRIEEILTQLASKAFLIA